MTAKADSQPVRLNMVFYGKHTQYDSRILELRPEFLIANPPHGLWGEVYGYGTPWLLQNISEYKTAGIKVIGYITSGYEGSGSGSGIDRYWYTLELNKKLIKNMAEIDRVDGVFIDECSVYPSAAQKQYLKELTSLVHSYKLITWGNTGVDQFDEWFFTDGGFDFMQSTEDWRGQRLTPMQERWGYRISVTGINPSYTVQDAFNLTIDAWNKGLAYSYISDIGYSSISSWIEEYVALLSQYKLDKSPPYVSDVNPAKGSVDIEPDSQITVHIKDDGNGVDSSSIKMKVNGSPVTPTVTGSHESYALTYRPPIEFGYGQVVEVSVEAQDMAKPSNRMYYLYSFTVLFKTAIPPTPAAPQALTPTSPSQGLPPPEQVETPLPAPSPDRIPIITRYTLAMFTLSALVILLLIVSVITFFVRRRIYQGTPGKL